MKKWLKVLCSSLLVATFALSFAGCSIQGDTASVYDVAQKLGYEKETEWISGVTGVSTEARKLYEEAKADGYDKSFVEFLKEIGHQVAQDNSAHIASAAMATVAVTCSFKTGYYSYGPYGKPTYNESTSTSSGAGVIYSLNKEAGSAYVITNYHVVYNKDSTGSEETPHISDEINIYLYGALYGSGKSAIEAEYVGGAMDYDLAVLKVENSELIKNSYACAIKRADSDAISIGEAVYAIGNPVSEGISVTQGVVSVETEYVTLTTCDETRQVSRLEIRIDAPVNHGNSGGGLYNADGKLIGIVNARSEESGVVGFGYAIPSNLAISVAQNILDNSLANASKGALRATLGIQTQIADSYAVYDEENEKTYVTETVKVSDVTAGSVAAGILKKNDVFYSIKINNGAEKVITRMHMLGDMMFNVRLGDKVTLVVYRDDTPLTLEINFNSNEAFTAYR